MKYLFVFALAVVLAGCATTGIIAKLETELTQQKTEISYLKGRIDAMSDDIARIAANQQAAPSRNSVTPGTASQPVVPSTTAVTGVQLDTTSGRCQAITAAGTQCARKAQPGRKYCWQHQNYGKATSSSGSSDRQILTGPRGGKYYINSNGKKVYIRKKK